MVIKRPVLIKNILIECDISPGSNRQSLTKKELTEIYMTITNHKTIIKNLKEQLKILANKGSKDKNVKFKGTQES